MEVYLKGSELTFLCFSNRLVFDRLNQFPGFKPQLSLPDRSRRSSSTPHVLCPTPLRHDARAIPSAQHLEATTGTANTSSRYQNPALLLPPGSWVHRECRWYDRPDHVQQQFKSAILPPQSNTTSPKTYKRALHNSTTVLISSRHLHDSGRRTPPHPQSRANPPPKQHPK